MTGDGVDISGNTAAVTLSAGSIGNTNDPAGIGVRVGSGTGDVTVGASVTKTTAGHVVDVSGHTGGTLGLLRRDQRHRRGGRRHQPDQQYRRDDELQRRHDALTTGANTAFNATGGGTVNVTNGANNHLTTTTGTALNVTNTTIGDNDLTFQDINSNGATNGIVLNTTTNANGSLIVTGNGGTVTNAATATGGAIQNSTGVGIQLTSMPGGVSLTRMFVGGGGNDGINGSSVTGFTLANSLISGNGNAVGENGIEFTNLLGTAVISDTTVHNSFSDNLKITNTSGTLNSLNIKNSTFDQSSIPVSPAGGNGVVITMQGTAVMTDGSINLSTFRNNFSNGILINTENTSRIGDDNAASSSTNGLLCRAAHLTTTISRSSSGCSIPRILRSTFKATSSSTTTARRRPVRIRRPLP